MTRAAAFVLGAILMASASPGWGQELGRLFFTPEQRAELDARRRARVPDKPAAVVTASPTMRLDGYVKRSGGKSTVWVNGESADQAQLPTGTDPRVTVNVGERGARVRLKPGETLDRGNGEVRDIIDNGEIRVRRAQ
jgi:hypothetical protein